MEIEHLLKKYYSISTDLNNQRRAIDVVKTNIMSKCEKLAREEGKTLDGGPFVCKWCLNTWQPNKYSVSLKPEKRPKKRMRSLLKKDISSLNKFQRKIVNKIKGQSPYNCLVFNCKICLKDTPLHLAKVKDQSTHLRVDFSNTQHEEQKKKKKKKKKDVFAGLNAAVLEKYRKPIENQDKKPKNTKINKKPAKIVNYSQQLQIHRALMQVPVPKKKPSLLSSFLDSM